MWIDLHRHYRRGHLWTDIMRQPWRYLQAVGAIENLIAEDRAERATRDRPPAQAGGGKKPVTPRDLLMLQEAAQQKTGGSSTDAQ